ncbi:hypothetical protein D3C87_1766540 [compost metagenome]
MAPQHLLDFAGVHVEAAGNDHVLLAVGQVQVAFGVDVADVAGVQPAVDEGFGGLVRLLVVALHDQVAAHADLAGGTAWQDPLVIVHDLHADQRVGTANR